MFLTRRSEDATPSGVKLIDYINGLDRYIDYKFRFNQDVLSLKTPEPHKIYTELSKEQVAHDFIDFLLQGLHSSEFAGINLESYRNEILEFLPNAIQNKFRMYGKIQIINSTGGHGFQNFKVDLLKMEGEYSPDNIVDRKNLYLFYVDQLIQLLSIKYNKPISNEKDIRQTFSDIIDYIKYSTINRIDGILAYEIAKYKNPKAKEIIFYIPVKYVINKNLTPQGVVWNLQGGFEDSANEIKEDALNYLNKSGVYDLYYIEPKLIPKEDNKKYWKFKLTKK